MVEKNQIFKDRLCYPFGGMRIVIVHISNLLPIISSVPDTVKAELMRVR